MEYTEIIQRLPFMRYCSISPSRTFPRVAHQPLKYPVRMPAHFPQLSRFSEKLIVTESYLEGKRQARGPKYVPSG